MCVPVGRATLQLPGENTFGYNFCRRSACHLHCEFTCRIAATRKLKTAKEEEVTRTRSSVYHGQKGLQKERHYRSFRLKVYNCSKRLQSTTLVTTRRHLYRSTHHRSLTPKRSSLCASSGACRWNCYRTNP